MVDFMSFIDSNHVSPETIDLLRKAVQASKAVAQQHEANAQAELAQAQIHIGHAEAYEMLASQCEKMLSNAQSPLPNEAGLSSANGHMTATEEIANRVANFVVDPRQFANMSAPKATEYVLRHFPDGLASKDIREVLERGGIPLARSRMAAVLSGSSYFEKEQIGVNQFIWRLVPQGEKTSSLPMAQESELQENTTNTA